MEYVNDFINLSFKVDASTTKSYCKITQDESYIYLTFGLNANDCLFELTENNYEFHIRFAKNYFEKYNEPIDINIEEQTICCNTQSKLLEIINCKLNGIHKKIFLESTILFLL